MDSSPVIRFERLVRQCIAREKARDWADLRAVPSTYTWKRIDYLNGLASTPRAALEDALVMDALYGLTNELELQLHPGRSGHHEYGEMLRAMVGFVDWKYTDVRSLHQLARDPLHALKGIPAAVLEAAQKVQPAKAGQIRKAVNRALVKRLGARAENERGGDWRYMGEHSGRPFTVSIDYGGRDQLRYEVAYDDAASGLHVRRLCYERLVGVGLGHWDALTTQNLEASAELLGELVTRVLDLPEQYASAP